MGRGDDGAQCVIFRLTHQISLCFFLFSSTNEKLDTSNFIQGVSPYCQSSDHPQLTPRFAVQVDGCLLVRGWGNYQTMMAEQESNQCTYYCTFNTLFYAGGIASTLASAKLCQIIEHRLQESRTIRPCYDVGFRTPQTKPDHGSQCYQLLTSLSRIGVTGEVISGLAVRSPRHIY